MGFEPKRVLFGKRERIALRSTLVPSVRGTCPSGCRFRGPGGPAFSRACTATFYRQVGGLSVPSLRTRHGADERVRTSLDTGWRRQLKDGGGPFADRNSLKQPGKGQAFTRKRPRGVGASRAPGAGLVGEVARLRQGGVRRVVCIPRKRLGGLLDEVLPRPHRQADGGENGDARVWDFAATAYR